ncbi:MAG TPA: 4Fe-4S dicluster domain-containing protein [Armatimonadota bacterium]
MQNDIRSKAKELLQSGEVQTVIGYETGSVPFKSTPCFAVTPEDADRLVWNPTCVNNLAVYLPQVKGKVAVLLKPCDAKNLVELLKENQVKRENVVAIVVSCPGVLNFDALKGINLKDVKSIEWRGADVVVTTSEGETVIAKDKALAGKCLSCDIVEPAIADVKIGDLSAKTPVADKFAAIAEYEKLSPAERRAFWAKQFERCIRCYACRQACPGCYCKECFVDKNGELWVTKQTDATANWFFHMGRMMHIAGRCTGCGECERACPMNIPLSLMSKRISQDVKEMFASEAGADSEASPTLGCFTMNDPDPCPE